MAERNVPFDLQAERATLGSVLLDRDAILALSWFEPDWFYLEKHEFIFKAARAIAARRTPPDIATVAAELRAREQLDLVGGIAFLGELTLETPTAAHVEYYGRAVEKCAILRRLIETGGRIAAMGYDEESSLDETLAKAEQEVFRIGHSRRSDKGFVSLAKGANDVLTWLASDADAGLDTGFYDLDGILGGLQPGDLAILAGRPSMGKTALALAIADYVGITRGDLVQMFSLEMSLQQLVIRLACARCGISSTRVRPGRLNADEMALFTEALGQIARDNFIVDDTPAEHINTMRSKARRAAATRQPALIIVDYLGLAQADAKDRVQEVSKISAGLKAMGREIGCPVLALAQLSRAVEGRSVKVPQLSDLRDSGAIEQDADVVMFIHREDYYDKASQLKGIAEIHVSKHRNGPLGVAQLQFDTNVGTFRNLSKYQAPEGY